MKKNRLITITASLLLASSLIFTGCQDPIFAAIREDVKPEEATVSGNIGFITRYTSGSTEYLFVAADDGLKYKDKNTNSHGAWSNFSVPFEQHHYDFDSSSHKGEQIIGVLADNAYLYLITVVYEHTSIEGTSYPATLKLWAYNGSWTFVTSDSSLFPLVYDSSTGYWTSNFRVFQTNAPIQDHRAAFLRIKDSDGKFKYYKFNGTSVPAEYDMSSASIIGTDSSNPELLSAVYFGSGYIFFTSPTATTNETYSNNANHFYYTNGDSTLYYGSGTADDTKNLGSCGTGHIISCLATTSDSIIIGHGKTSAGTAGGLSRATLTNGVLSSGTTSFSSNAQFQITSAYTVLTLLNASPEKTESESGLYASITFSGSSYNFDNIGLWSYYPERGNWNRE